MVEENTCPGIPPVEARASEEGANRIEIGVFNDNGEIQCLKQLTVPQALSLIEQLANAIRERHP